MPYLLLLYPIFFGNFSLTIPGLRALVQTGSRDGWLQFWAVGGVAEWIGLFVCSAALRREGLPLAHVGWTSRRLQVYGWALLLTVVFFLGVIWARHAGLYPPPGVPTTAEMPRGFRALFSLTSTPERCFWLAMSLTAGICEETMYRGFALTYLKRFFRWMWPGVLLATFAFAYFHGGFNQGAVQFTIRFGIGLGFVGIYLCRKSLLPAVLLHYLMDASLILAP